MKVIIEYVSKLYQVFLITKVCENLKLFVSDFCREIYRQFLPRHTYLINSSTGKGKSHTVTSHIIPLAFTRNKKVLLLVNRTKLAEQYLKDIKRAVVTGIIDYNPNTHSLVNDIENCLLILTYQQLETKLANNLDDTLLEIDKFDIVIADEVHYWLSDSTFNPGSRLSAEAVLMFLCSKTRYLLSATMDDIKPILLEPGTYMKPLFTAKERFFNPISKDDLARWEYDLWAIRNYEYVIPADYTYLNVFYFNKMDTIINYIFESDSDSKWLVFVNDRKMCKQIVARLKELFISVKPNCNPDEIATFISSDYRDIEEDKMKEVMDEITENENFKSKVLVSTSVLDCGINLKSKELLNIVICTDNKVSFFQMLGRRRILSQNDRINLYIPAMDISYFTRRSKRIEEIFSDVDQVCLADFDRFMTNVIYSKSDSRADSCRTVAFPFVETINNIRQTRLVVNELSRHQLRLLYDNYEGIINRFKTDGDDAFIKEQLDWLGLDYDINNWLPDNSQARIKKDLEMKLSAYMNKVISEEALTRILSEMKPEILRTVKEARSNRVSLKHANSTLESVSSSIRILKITDDQYKISQGITNDLISKEGNYYEST